MRSAIVVSFMTSEQGGARLMRARLHLVAFCDREPQIPPPNWVHAVLKEKVRPLAVHPRFRCFPPVFPEKRLDLKSLKG